MKKEIKIPATTENFFRMWLETFKLFKPFSSLRPKEMDVLAELLKQNHLLSNIPDEHRWKIVFDYDVKLKIKENLGNMRDESFQNILTSLRKKGFIINNRVPENYCIYPNEVNTLSYVYIINDDTKEG
jgi:hypothetical protein